jgi:hypothetical protein
MQRTERLRARRTKLMARLTRAKTRLLALQDDGVSKSQHLFTSSKIVQYRKLVVFVDMELDVIASGELDNVDNEYNLFEEASSDDEVSDIDNIDDTADADADADASDDDDDNHGDNGGGGGGGGTKSAAVDEETKDNDEDDNDDDGDGDVVSALLKISSSSLLMAPSSSSSSSSSSSVGGVAKGTSNRKHQRDRRASTFAMRSGSDGNMVVTEVFHKKKNKFALEF